jgi:hypothetical protein
MHRACTPANSVRLTRSAPTISRRDWPRGLGACLWHTIQEFNSPIPPQQFGPLAHSEEHSVCIREAVGAKPTGSTKVCCLRRSGDYAGLKNQRTQFDSARQHQNSGSSVMAGILVLGTSGGSSILPSPTNSQASSNGSGHRATNSETKVQFLPPAPSFHRNTAAPRSEAVMSKGTKNVVLRICEKRMGWVMS